MRETDKLILIMPPQPGLLKGFAAGLVNLANYVVAAGPDTCVAILDLSATSPTEAKRQVDCAIEPTGPSRLFVGITATTASYQAALATASAVRSARPDAIIVMGGAHASGDSEVVLRNHQGLIDVVILGEGERSLCELLRHYPKCEVVPGAAYIVNGEYHVNDPPKLLPPAELDAIPLTYRNNGLIGTPGKFDHVTYVSARGCPLTCAFCAVGDDVIRSRSVGAVIRDIDRLITMGFRSIAIEDNFFAQSPARTRALTHALADLRQTKAFTWDCQTRVESLARPETIALMAGAGCEAVYVGVESFHPKHLRYLGKTSRPEAYLSQLNDIVSRLCQANIACYINLQFGLPDESIEHEHHTLAILRTLGQEAKRHGTTITVFPQLHVV